MTKYGNVDAWKSFVRVFDYLPIAAVIGGEIFCVHGGLTHNADTFDKIKQLDRIQETPINESVIHELLLGDPDNDQRGWGIRRSAGFNFGPDITEDFCNRNGVKMMIRSRSLKMMGY